MKKSNGMKKKGVITSALLSGAFGLTTLNASGENLYNYSDMGSGAELRSELIDLNSSSSQLAVEAVSFGKHVELKCGEGKCGEGKCGEGTCGEGIEKAGAETDSTKSEEAKKADVAKEGEEENKATEAKCGEGKCGEGKCGEKK